MLEEVFRSHIGRIVTFVLTPILLPLVGAGAVWAQDVIGIDLDPAQVTAYVGAVVIGLAIVVYKWLANRGDWERIIVQQVQQLHAEGETALAQGGGFDPIEELGGIGNRGADAEPIPNNPEAIKDPDN